MYVEGRQSIGVGGGSTQEHPADFGGEYVHDYTAGSFKHPDGEPIVEVGPPQTVLVRMSDIHELPQIRETITQRDIEDLADKIIRDNELLDIAETPEEITAALDLMHPPGLILLQPDELEDFLAQHADFYELDQPVTVLHGGRPVILRNEGHRRARAIEHIIVKKKSLTLEQVGIWSNLHTSMGFPEANQRQAKENSHVQTSALEDAKNIIRQYKFLQRNEGKAPSAARIASIYGFSETKVRNAIAFDTLPKEVKDLAGSEKGEEQLPYSLIADLAQLRDLYDKRYVERMIGGSKYHLAENREVSVAEEIRGFAYELAADKKVDKSLKKVYKRLAGEKGSVEEGLTIPLEQFMLFEAKRVDPTKRKEEAYRKHGANCLYGMELAASNGVLDNDMISRIERLVEVAKSLAKSAEPDNQESMF